MVLTLLELGEEGTVLQPLAHVQVGVGQPDVHLRVWVERCLFFTLFFSNLLERNARNAQAFAFFPPFFWRSFQSANTAPVKVFCIHAQHKRHQVLFIFTQTHNAGNLSRFKQRWASPCSALVVVERWTCDVM